MQGRGAYVVFLLAIFTRAGFLNAQTLTLPSTADTYLKSGTPNQSQGNETILRIQASGHNRSLVRFDSAAIVAAVGTGSLASARLELYIQSNSNNWGSAGRTVDAHRLTAPWTEAGATWNCGVDANPGNIFADCSPQWSGGQFEEEPSDTVLHTNSLTGWVSFDITADVRAFLAGPPNYGWLIKKADEGQSGQVDYTSRQGAVDRRPRLVLVVESAAFDEVPPSLRITAPDQKVVVNDATPEIRIEYTDGGSGVDPSSLQVLVDTTDITARCSAGAMSATCEPPALAAGGHTVHATVSDRAGNESQDSFAFELLVGPGLHTLTFSAIADTWLRQGTPNQSQGNESLLRVQATGHNRALVRFDHAALATALAGATLRSAELDLYVEANGDNWGRSGRAVTAHRLTSAWTESGATWNCANDSNPSNLLPDCLPQWNGGAFASAPTASVLHTNGLRGWVRFDVTADLAAFLAGGTSNHGWLLKKADEWLSGRVDYTARTGAQAPRLVVTFELPVTDTAPPTIAIGSPVDGSFVATSRPSLTAVFSDAESGVDPTSVRLVLDGVDKTAEAQVTSSGLAYIPLPALPDGRHTAEVEVRDNGGNKALAGWSFTVDASAPQLTITSPRGKVIAGYPRLEVSLAVADATSGVDWPDSSVRIDGVEVAASCALGPESAVCGYGPIASGSHSVVVIVRDKAGNTATASLDVDFVLDQEPPVMALATPQDGAIVRTSPIEVSGTVADTSGIEFLSVNGRELDVVDGRFRAEVTLEEGVNSVSVTARDLFGYSREVEAKVVLDTVPPSLDVTSPSPGQITNQPTVRLSGVSQDESGLASLDLNGVPIASTNGPFEFYAPLAEGANLLTVRVVDRAGNAHEIGLEVFRYTLPAVTIAYPADLSFVAATSVEVRGSVSEPSASVTVNGVAAVVSAGAFVARDVPLIEGGNIVTAVARSSNGRQGTASAHIVRDLLPPRLAIDLPRDRSTVFEASVTVSGMVNDIVAGTVNASDAVVTVNGRRAKVANRSFLLEGLPLSPGENLLTVTAVDASGNTGQTSVTVFRAEPVVPRLVVISGDRQEAVIGQPLGAPLVVELRDAANRPVAGRPVIFKVRGGDGVLSGGRRQIAMTTDTTGRAAASFTLGMRAGVGNQRVEASATGFSGPAAFSVDALPGEPARLLVDAGDQQVGIAGQALPRPLVAVVTDAGFNRIEGAAVEWTVTRGRGRFATGQQELLAPSDSDGRVIVPFILDADEGIANNIVEARIAGLADGPAVGFVASGRAAGSDPAATAVSGIVLDNSNLPVAGAALRILDTPLTTRTDAQGRFRLAGVPVGAIRLVVDGSTVERAGSWPDLEFVVTPVPGRENPLTMPVYLLPLDLAHGVVVDEIRGGMLTLPEIPGFALDIAPGSVVFPGGSRSGVVSVTAVHNDKVPMVPNFGQQPRFIVTIQPAGARFDPPAKLTLPNLEGLKPGEVTELYSFDHDLGHFVSIGPGTVSEDGSVITSNPGVGILKAGWHCGGNPAAAGTPHDCPPCYVCNGSQCVPGCALPQADSGRPLGEIDLMAAAETSCDCSAQDPCLVGNRCTGGCRARQPGSVMALADDKPDGAVKPKGKPFIFSSKDLNVPDCGQPRYEWDFGDGTTSTSAVIGHAFDSPGNHIVTLKIRCGACDRVMAQDDVRVTVVALEIRVKAGADQHNVTGAKNWAALRGTGLVQLEAAITPDNPDTASRIQWAGATPDPANPRLATVEKSQAIRRTVTANVDDLSDTVEIWIVWVEMELRSTGTMSPTNDGSIVPGSGFPRLGAMTDEDDDIHAESAGNVEIVGHLQPRGVYAHVKGGWMIERYVSQAACTNGSFFITSTNKPDHSASVFLDLAPESDDKIYDADGPTSMLLEFPVDHTNEVYDTFVQHATWNGVRASDDLFWHYQAWIDDDLDAANKPRNRDTLLNDVGLGSLTLPQACHFQPRF